MKGTMWRVQRALARLCLASGGLNFVLMLVRHSNNEVGRMGTALLGIMLGTALLGYENLAERFQRLEAELEALRRQI